MMNQPSQRSPSKYLDVIAMLILGGACHAGPTIEPANLGVGSARVVNLHAFARLYGVVRWFHPSDAAAAIDWDRFAIEGVHRIINVPDAQARKAALTELIAPIAPTVHIVRSGEQFPDEPALQQVPGTTLDVVAWEHKGYGDSAVTSVYASKRRYRERIVPVDGYPYGALWQEVDAAAYQGARVRLRGKVRTMSPGRGQLWLRVDRGDAIGFSDNMGDRPIASKAWAPVEISGVVDADATRIVFGTTMSGRGTVWYDDLELATQGSDGTWKSVEIKDPGFELGDPMANWRPGLARASATTVDGWRLTADHDGPASGTASLRVEPITRVVNDELFADAPQPGETVDIDLGDGLRARIPIALYSKEGHTIGDDPEVARRSQTGQSASPPAGFDVEAGAADVIVVWNVLEHFWPYWDVVSVDWIRQLDTALRDSLNDRTIEDHVETLQRLSAAAPDGHARVACPGTTRRARPPFTVDVVEDQVVVTASADPTVLRGDVIITVNGRPAPTQLADDEALASGSPQFRRVRARVQFGAGPSGSLLTLRIRRGGIEHEVTVAREDKAAEGPRRPAIERLDDGVYYVDLLRASMPNLDAVMERLATAPGIVFDVRGHPNGNHNLLSHLLTRPDDSNAWLGIPYVIRPDHQPSSIPSWETLGWKLPVLQPHIAGRVAFLVGPETASYGESIMGLVEHYHLGAIVGSSTAGANGNFAQIIEPTGCSSVFTGLRVTKSDGSRFHQVGVQPTIAASRTIAGIAAGRDEVMERALTYVRGASK